MNVSANLPFTGALSGASWPTGNALIRAPSVAAFCSAFRFVSPVRGASAWKLRIRSPLNLLALLYTIWDELLR